MKKVSKSAQAARQRLARHGELDRHELCEAMDCELARLQMLLTRGYEVIDRVRDQMSERVDVPGQYDRVVRTVVLLAENLRDSRGRVARLAGRLEGQG